MKKVLIFAALALVFMTSCGNADSSINITESIIPQTTVSAVTDTVSSERTETVSAAASKSETLSEASDSVSVTAANLSETATVTEPVSTTGVTVTTAAATTTTAQKVTTAVTATVPKPVSTTAATTKRPAEYDGKSAEEILQTMSLEEKVGQLFIVRPQALGGSNTKLDSAKQTGLERYHVGGVCMFANNISTPQQITEYISSLQGASDIPLFIAVDEEGGRVARIANDADFKVKKYESMQAIGATGDTSKAYEAGQTIGGYLKKYGFNLDFAPVADVNTNPHNIVIGDRAFGSDPQLVSDMIKSAIRGFHSKGIMTCVKHFPGHGDTYGDTHQSSVYVNKTWEQLKECELIPFIGGIDAGTDMIMIAHINTPNITTDGLPASLSEQLIEGKLRGELGFGGVIITDSLEMNAITSLYSSDRSAVMAIKAGADIVLMPENLDKAYNGVMSAVKSGEISQQRLDESVLRILKLKQKYGII